MNSEKYIGLDVHQAGHYTSQPLRGKRIFDAGPGAIVDESIPF
jgi:hypothetical protein